MRIKRLRAVGWRNLAPLDLTFDPSVRLNVLFGDNAQGKTNVLEALYYLATFRSFRTTEPADLVQAGVSEARITVDVETQGLVRSVESRLIVQNTPSGSWEPARDASPGKSLGAGMTDPNTPERSKARHVSRTIMLDGKRIRGIRAAFGVVAVVLFVPEDLLLVRAAPAARRRFLDMAISGVERGYFDEAATFQKVLRSRNALLRVGRGSVSPSLLDTYDEQLAQAGARVVMRRREMVRALEPEVHRMFRALHAVLPVELRYESNPAVAAAALEGEVVAVLLRGLVDRRAIDERRGHTTFGPQTDDLKISLDGRPASEHASQGQLRSLVLALKLAELSNLESRHAEAPILLLDDVPSELDPTRRRYLFDALGHLSCQAVITVAERAVVPLSEGRGDFLVKAGEIGG